MSALYENFIRDDTRPDRIVLTGTSIILNDESFSPDRHLIVRATSVEVQRPIKLPGKFVHIFAQTITVLEQAFIDVSGEVGSPDFSLHSRAKDGQLPSEAGMDGPAGGPGQDAGEIKLVADRLIGSLKVIANGGKGGRGQDGGFGARGQAGGAGINGVSENNREAANGGNGFKGGRAGYAGKPGKGGNGGKIVIAIREGVEPDQIKTEAAPGNPGETALSGQVGPGGSGGAAGSWFKKVQVRR